jgi:integrase
VRMVPAGALRSTLLRSIKGYLVPKANRIPDTHKGDLDLTMACFASSRADSSMNRYKGHWERFVSYCASLQVRPLPAKPLHVAMFLAATMRHCSAKGLTYAPVKMASAAIYTAHHLLGFNAGVTDHPFVANVRNCAKRVLGHKALTNRKAPAPARLCLDTCRRLLRQRGVFYLQLAAFIMLCFAGFFRFSDAAGIRSKDVSFHKGFMVIHLRKRKNDQFRQGSSVHVAAGQSDICPVALTKRLVAAGKHQGPWLFKHMQGLHARDRSQVTLDGSKRLNYGQIKRQALKELATTANMSVAACTKLFGTHSFRSGGATKAFAAGVPTQSIQLHGGWRNPQSMQVYIKRPVRALLATSNHLGY